MSSKPGSCNRTRLFIVLLMLEHKVEESIEDWSLDISVDYPTLVR